MAASKRSSNLLNSARGLTTGYLRTASDLYNTRNKSQSPLQKKDEEDDPIDTIGSAVEKLNAMEDNSWAYDEKDQASVREDLRKMASEAYEAATPEQRAQNKDFITAASMVLNPSTKSAPAAPTAAPAAAPASADAMTTSSISPDLRRARATENVALQRQYGSGLGAQAAMQSPDYELGSGSALRAAPRRLGTRSGDMRREARRLRKQGYGRAAEQMALGAAQQKLSEGSSIKSEAQRGREAFQQQQQQDQMRQMQGLMQDAIGLRRSLIDEELEKLRRRRAARDPRFINFEE